MRPPAWNAKWLILLCYGSDQSAGDATTTNFYTNLFHSGQGDSISNYWVQQSYGANSFYNDVRGWYKTAHDTQYLASHGLGVQVQECLQSSGLNAANYYNVVAVYAGQPYRNVNMQAGGTSLAFQSGNPNVVVDAFSPYAGIQHEMGHGFGLDHSYADTNDIYCGAAGEYGDNWDVMSFDCNIGTFAGNAMPSGGDSRQGVGLTTWNRWKLGWLSASKKSMFWPGSVGSTALTQQVSVIARTHPEVSGPLVVYVPATPTTMYTVEYVSPDGWDRGVGARTLLVHRIYYGDQHTYIVKTLPNAFQTAPGNPFVDTAAGVRIEVTSLLATQASVNITVDPTVNQQWIGATSGQPPATPANVAWLGVNAPIGENNGQSGVSPFIFPAGSEQLSGGGSHPLYACRTWYYGEQLGKTWVGAPGCAFGWGGQERWSGNYQVLSANLSSSWVNGSNGSIPAGALVGGYENNSPLYVCRAWLSQSQGYAPGKLVSWGACDVSYGGQELFFSSYQILVPA